MDFLEKVGSAIVVKGKEASDKAKEMARIANLKSQIVTCEDVIKKNYTEIGKHYFEMNRENPNPEFEKQFRSIENAMSGIKDLKRQIEEVKELYK